MFVEFAETAHVSRQSCATSASRENVSNIFAKRISMISFSRRAEERLLIKLSAESLLSKLVRT